MNESHEPIERELRAMTEWEGPTPQLWRGAIDVEGARADETGRSPARAQLWAAVSSRLWGRNWLPIAAAGVAAAVLLSLAIVPGFRAGRSGPPNRSPEMVGGAASVLGAKDSLITGTPAEADYDEAPEIDLQAVLESTQGGGGGEARGMIPFVSGGLRADQPGPAPERAVVRKATIEIATPDVRAAALRARQLLSEPRGEYVESADIDESDSAHPRADLVLRVEASRLEEVISQLRELGEVGAEHLDGEDVTDQMVDLGARLENERRVEAELAELLEKRENDKLEEILAVRRELGEARERIERLAAQQDNLARMVSLARVAVMLRTEIKPAEPEPKKGVWDGFRENLGAAWADGLAALLGTVAGFVRVLVGGAIWFALAALAIALVWRRWRAERPRALTEQG